MRTRLRKKRCQVVSTYALPYHCNDFKDAEVLLGDSILARYEHWDSVLYQIKSVQFRFMVAIRSTGNSTYNTAHWHEQPKTDYHYRCHHSPIDDCPFDRTAKVREISLHQIVIIIIFITIKIKPRAEWKCHQRAHSLVLNLVITEFLSLFRCEKCMMSLN